MRTVSWPTKGDAPTFQRRLATSIVAGATLVLVVGVLAVVLHPPLWKPVVPLAVSAARRAEVVRSFAGLAVLHHGQSIEVASRPLVGEYPTRRLAARAALDRGGWAVIVHAWDRYYVLRGEPTTSRASRPPVAFRTRAVADVVPAIRDDVALGA
jgi:hypothetical protein